jgi:hypothetical protein
VTHTPRHPVCRNCGLESSVSHASVDECIVALRREGHRLSEHLRNGVPGARFAPHARADRADDRAAAPRLAPRVENS